MLFYSVTLLFDHFDGYPFLLYVFVVLQIHFIYNITWLFVLGF